MRKLFSFMVIAVALLFSTTKVAAQYHEIINEHHVKIEVKENGDYRFTHDLDVTFYTPAYGIFVNIPTRYDMVWNMEDGTSLRRRYKFPLKDFDIVGPHEKESQSEGWQLRLGRKGVYVNGPQHYRYSYTMKTRDLRLDGRQRFYVNLLGSDWVSPTEKVSFEIHFPKPIDPDKIQFYGGAYGATNPLEVDFDLDGLVLSGHTVGTLEPYEAFTIDVALEDRFFTFPKGLNTYFVGALYAFVFFGLFIRAFFKHGKDDPAVPTIQFEAPKHLSSAQVGYIYDGFTDTRDIVSLIIYWAANGYLMIEELDRKNIQLTRVKELPPSTIAAEKSIFNGLFGAETSVTTKDLKHKFYPTLIDGQKNITRYYEGNKARRIFSGKADALQIVFALLLPSIFLVYYALSHYQITYDFMETFMAVMILGSFGVAIALVSTFVIRKFEASKKTSRAFGVIFMTASLFVYGITMLFAAKAAEANMFLFTALFVGYVVGIIINGNMHKRTELGLSYYNDILGLKDFIEYAEKDRLETLVEEDPEYFYHILPFAYVLNVSDKWSKQFESIAVPPPAWYTSTTPMEGIYFMNHFNRNLNRSINSLYSSMSTPPPSKGGRGGGSFGGGGGGFSGGGFGGGGGGGWR